MRLVKESARIACLFAVAGLLTLAGCTKVAAPAQDGATESTLKTVLQRGTLRVAELERTRKLDFQLAGLAEHWPGWRLRLWIGRNVDGEESASEAALSSAGQVDVALVTAFEEAANLGRLAPGSHRVLVGALRLQQA